MSDFPAVNLDCVDNSLREEMKTVREIVSQGLQLRAQNKIKVRQPLRSISINQEKEKLINREEYLQIIKEELNLKEVEFVSLENNAEEMVVLDSEITVELQLEGMARA